MPRVKIEVNRKIFNWLEQNPNKVLLVYGGAGSGKSYTVAQWLLTRILKWPAHALITRKRNPSIKISVLPLVKGLLDEWGIPYEHKVADQVLIVGKSKIFFRGLDDPEKVKSAEFNYIWLEEATEFTREDYQQLRLRLRRHNNGRYRNKMVLTFNPISMHHWIYEEFFTKQVEDTDILHTTYKDNLRWLDPDAVKILEQLAQEDEYFYKVYALGQWASRKGLIYDNYEVIPDAEADAILERADEVIYGLDFGYNNPTAMLKIAIRDGIYYIVDEIYQTHLTNADLIRLLPDFVRPRGVIYADAAEPARIEEIAEHGYDIMPAVKSVRDGIDFVKRQRIKVAERCENTIKEFRTYKWKEDRDGHVKDEPVKFMDHAMDALRYALYTHALEGGGIGVAFID